MEVKVQNAQDVQSKFPQGSVLSIRYGSTRRQAPISSLHNHTLKFPDSRDGSSSMRIDVLRPVCKYVQTLAHDSESYRLNLSGDEGTQVECELSIKNEPKFKGQKQVADPPVSMACEKYHDAAKVARSYLEEHRLLQYFQQLLHACIQEKPSDPKRFVWERIGSCLNGQMQDPTVAESLGDARKHMQKMQEAESLRRALEQQLKEMDLRVQKLTASKATEEQVAYDLKELEDLRQVQVEYEKEKVRRQAQDKQLQVAEEFRRQLERTVEDLTKRADTIKTSLAAEQGSVSEAVEIEKKASKMVKGATAKMEKEYHKQMEEATDQREKLQIRINYLEELIQQQVQASDAVEKQPAHKSNESEAKREEPESQVTGFKQSANNLIAAKSIDAQVFDQQLEEAQQQGSQPERTVQQVQDKADQLVEHMAEAKAVEEKEVTVAALAQTSSAEKQREASLKKTTSVETSAEKQINDSTVQAPSLRADLEPLPPSALPENVPPPSSPPAPLPSNKSAEEEELKGLVKQQVVEATKSGALQNAITDVATQDQAGDSTQKAFDDEETSRMEVQKALEAAWDNGALRKALSEHASRLQQIEEVKRSMNRSLELAKQNGTLGDALMRFHEEFEKEKKALVDPIGIAIRDGQLVRAMNQSQQEADQKVMETKELLKSELLKASGTGALLCDLNAVSSLTEQTILVNSN